MKYYSQEYTAKLLNGVRRLRARDCEAERLMLADFMEEFSNRDSAPRTAAMLRSSAMVVGSLDVEAIHALFNCCYGKTQGRMSEEGHRMIREWFDEIGVSRATMDPKEYVHLWEACYELRADLTAPDVVAEAVAVHALKQELEHEGADGPLHVRDR